MADVMLPTDILSEQLTPRSAAQTLVGYQENHQIELFMQEMLSVVFAILPEDPFEYMNLHIATHRPAPPPQHFDNLCGSAALWVLLPGGEPLCAEHWRLRRCWLTQQGHFCVSNATSQVTKSGDGLMISPPMDDGPRDINLGTGTTFKPLNEDEAARPFAFRVIPSGATTSGGFVFAAGSGEQRDEWRELFGHFADPIKSRGPPPKSPRSLSPRLVESKVPHGTFTTPATVNALPMEVTMPIAPQATAQVQPKAQKTQKQHPPMTPPVMELPSTPMSPPPRKPTITAMDVPSSNVDTRQRAPLKPILKNRSVEQNPGVVPAIRIPHNAGSDPMEACSSTSTRFASVRFSDDVQQKAIPAVGRSEPVPVRARVKSKSPTETTKALAQQPKAPAAPQPKAPQEPPGQPAEPGFSPPPRSPRGTAVADAVMIGELPEEASKSVAPPAVAPAAKDLTRDEALEAAARVLTDVARTGSHESAAPSSGRQDLVKGILENLVDQLERDPESSFSVVNSSASSVGDHYGAPQSAKSCASLASSDAREVMVSDMVYGLTKDVVDGVNDPADLSARVVTTELARSDDRVSSVMEPEAGTEQVTDDVFSNLVGQVISDLFTDEAPTTRDQLTARVLSARSATSESGRSGVASQNAYDLVATLIGDALERPMAPSLPLHVDLPIDVPAGTAVADAVDVMLKAEPPVPSTGRSMAQSVTAGPYVDRSNMPDEFMGDIAADMLDQMMLEPILQLIEEPVDPAVVLLGDALPPLYSARSTWSATSSDLREELALAAMDEMLGGTGVADAIDVMNPIEEEAPPQAPPKPPARDEAPPAIPSDEGKSVRAAPEVEMPPKQLITRTTEVAPKDEESETEKMTARSVGMVSLVSATMSETCFDQAGSLISDVLEEAAQAAEAEAKEKAAAAEQARRDLEFEREEAERRKVAEAAARKEAEAMLKEAQRRAAENDEAARQGALAEQKDHDEAQRKISEAEAKRDASKRHAQAKLEEAKKKAAEAEESRLKALAEEEVAAKKALDAQAAKERAVAAEEARQKAALAEAEVARKKAEDEEATKRMRLELLEAKGDGADSSFLDQLSVRSSNCHEDCAENLVDGIVEEGVNKSLRLKAEEEAAEEEARRKAAEEELRLKAAEEEAQRQAEAQKKAKEQAEADAEAARKAAEEQARLDQLLKEAQAQADAEELVKLEAAKKKAEEEEEARRKAAEEQARLREAEEADARLKAEQEEAKRKFDAEKEEARVKAEQEEALRKLADAKEPEAQLQLFFDLPGNKVDSTAFQEELFAGLRGVGASDDTVGKLNLSLLEANTVAEVSGPCSAIADLQKLPLTTVSVGGSLARLRREDLPTNTLPNVSPELRSSPRSNPDASAASGVASSAGSAALSQMQYELASDMIGYLVQAKTDEIIQADIAAAANAAAANAVARAGGTAIPDAIEAPSVVQTGRTVGDTAMDLAKELVDEAAVVDAVRPTSAGSISRLSDQETEAQELAAKMMEQLVVGSERPTPIQGPMPAGSEISALSQQESDDQTKGFAQKLMQQMVMPPKPEEEAASLTTVRSRPVSASISEHESQAQAFAQNLMEQLVEGTEKPTPSHGLAPQPEATAQVHATSNSMACSDISREDVEQGMADRLVHGMISGNPGEQAVSDAVKAQEEASLIFNDEVKRKAAEEEAKETKRKADEVTAELARQKGGSQTARSGSSIGNDNAASAVSSDLEGAMATAMITQMLGGSAVADAIEVDQVPVKPAAVEPSHELLELFFAAPYAKIDHSAFKSNLKEGLKGLGASEPTITSLQIDLRAGSTIAEIRGPPPSIMEIKGLDLSKLNVMGYYAKPSAEELKAAEEEAARRRAAVEEEARRKNVEEQLRLEAIALEKEVQQKKAEEEQARLEAEGQAAAAEEARQRAAEQQLKLQQEAEEAEAARRKAAEDEARVKAFAAEKARQEAADEAVRLTAARQKVAQEVDEAARQIAEEEARVQEFAVVDADRKAAEETEKLKAFAAEEARQRAAAETPAVRPRSAGSSSAFTVDSEKMEGEVAEGILSRLMVGLGRPAPKAESEVSYYSARTGSCSAEESAFADKLVTDMLGAQAIDEAARLKALAEEEERMKQYGAVSGASSEIEGSVALSIVDRLIAAPEPPPDSVSASERAMSVPASEEAAFTAVWHSLQAVVAPSVPSTVSVAESLGPSRPMSSRSAVSAVALSIAGSEQSSYVDQDAARLAAMAIAKRCVEEDEDEEPSMQLTVVPQDSFLSTGLPDGTGVMVPIKDKAMSEAISVDSSEAEGDVAKYMARQIATSIKSEDGTAELSATSSADNSDLVQNMFTPRQVLAAHLKALEDAELLRLAEVAEEERLKKIEEDARLAEEARLKALADEEEAKRRELEMLDACSGVASFTPQHSVIHDDAAEDFTLGLLAKSEEAAEEEANRRKAQEEADRLKALADEAARQAYEQEKAELERLEKLAEEEEARQQALADAAEAEKRRLELLEDTHSLGVASATPAASCILDDEAEDFTEDFMNKSMKAAAEQARLDAEKAAAAAAEKAAAEAAERAALEAHLAALAAEEANKLSPVEADEKRLREIAIEQTAIFEEELRLWEQADLEKAISDSATAAKVAAEVAMVHEDASFESARMKSRMEEDFLRKIVEEELQKKAIEDQLKLQGVADDQARMKAIADEQARLKKEAEEHSKQHEIAEAAAKQKLLTAEGEEKEQLEVYLKEHHREKMIADEEARLRDLVGNEAKNRANQSELVLLEAAAASARASAAQEEQNLRMLAEEEAKIRAAREANVARHAAEDREAEEEAVVRAASKRLEELHTLTEEAEKSGVSGEELAKLKADEEAAKVETEKAEAARRADSSERKKVEEGTKQRKNLLVVEQAQPGRSASKQRFEEDALRRASDEAERLAKLAADEERRRAEEELKQINDAAEEAKLKAEEEEVRLTARREAEDQARQDGSDTARRKAQEEQDRLAKEAEDARLKAEEEAARIKAEADEEARRQAEEEARRKAEADAESQRALAAAEKAGADAAELEALRKQAEADEEARRKAAEEAARLRALEEQAAKDALAAKLKADEEAKAKAAEAARLKALADEEARKKEEAETARLRALEDEANRKKAAEEQARLKKEAEEARLKALADEEARKKAEAERLRLKALEDEAARKKSEEEAARRKAEKEAARLQEEADEAARKKAAEERKKRLADEAKAAEDAKQKKFEADEAKRKAAEEKARADALAKKEQQMKDDAENEARRLASIEKKKKKAEEEAEAKRKVDEEAARKVAEKDANKKKRLAELEESNRKAQEAADAEAAKRKAAEEARKADAEKARLKALAEEEERLKKIADKKAKDRAADESARRKTAEAAEAKRQKKLEEEAAEAARQAARLKQIEDDKAKVRADAVEAKSKADVLEDQMRALQNDQKLLEAQKASREDDFSGSSTSSQDILERLLRTFVRTAAGTLRNLADEEALKQGELGKPQAGKPSCKPPKDSPVAVKKSPEPIKTGLTDSYVPLPAVPVSQLPARYGNAPITNFNATAPPGVGLPRQAPIVPPLWQPHPRSDGFVGWRAPSSVGSECSESAPGTERFPFGASAATEQAQTLPTFKPQTMAPASLPQTPNKKDMGYGGFSDNAATLPRGQELPVFQPTSGMGSGGKYDQTRIPAARGYSPEAVTPTRQSPSLYMAPSSGNLVDPEIMNRLAALLCAPATPHGEFEHYARYGGEKPADTSYVYEPLPPYQQAPMYQSQTVWTREAEPPKQITPPARSFETYAPANPGPKQSEERVGSWNMPSNRSAGSDIVKEDLSPEPNYFQSQYTPSDRGYDSRRSSGRRDYDYREQTQQPAGRWDLPMASPSRSESYASAPYQPYQQNNQSYAMPKRNVPESDVSSAAWSAQLPDAPVSQVKETRPRSADLGIPSLPLATITSSSFGAGSGGPKDLALAFSSALDQLTNAMYRSADALDSSRSGATSVASWARGPTLPMPIHQGPVASEEEEDLEYRQKPFSNYAGMTIVYPEPKEASSAHTGPSGYTGELAARDYDKEISQLTKQFALSGRSDASSASRQSLPMHWGAAPKRGLIVGSSATRPDADQLQDMADAIGERCGPDQIDPAMSMLGVMTDSLFGTDPRAPNGGFVPSNVQRPGPRVLDAIAQRVVKGTGSNMKADAVRSLVGQLTNSIFGSTDGQDSQTARSSVRSQSSAASGVMGVANAEVRGILTEYCSELFAAY